MTKIQVFNFRVYDVAAGDMIIPPRKSTLDRIERIGGTVIAATEEWVSSDEIDGEGKHVGPTSRDGSGVR